MDTVLMLVTALSLAMAIGLALVVAKLLRDDRRRSDARVAALTEMAAEPVPIAPPVITKRPAPVAVAHARPAPAVHAPVTRATRPRPIDDLELRPSQPAVTGVGELFSERAQSSPWGARLGVAAALVALALVVGFAATSLRSANRGAGAQTAQAPAAAVSAAPLELLSLRHTQQSQSLTVTGIVHNPKNGSPLSRVAATAYVFGADGAFLSSARAPLDFTTLAPGEDSPFVVTVPVTGEITRYRIGFRADDGSVIAHVDKRGPDALAQK